MIDATPDSYKPRTLGSADELHHLARNRQAALDLGADRKPLNALPQEIGEKGIALVPAVIANLIPQKTGADSDFDLMHHV